jgi:hypothetical protein
MSDAHDVDDLHAWGQVVIEGFLSGGQLRAVREALAPHLEREVFGRNPFEGLRTQRVYNLPALGRVFTDLIEHPRVLAICDAFLAPNYLLTAAQAINLPGGGPGVRPDDGFYPFRPASAAPPSSPSTTSLRTRLPRSSPAAISGAPAAKGGLGQRSPD